MTVRRCRRCGGLLTSEKSVSRGIGVSCERKERDEAAEQSMMKNQISLFDNGNEDSDISIPSFHNGNRHSNTRKIISIQERRFGNGN